jgi:O-antigen/teichoic acid export membrane protein
MFAEQMLRMVAGLFVGIWVARYFGPEKFGIYSYAVAFSALFASIAKVGLDSIVIRDLINEPKLLDLYMGTAFWIKIAGAAIMLIAIGTVLALTDNDASTKLYVFIISAGAIFQAAEVVDFYFQSVVQSKVVSACKILQLSISVLIKVILIKKQAELVAFVVVTCLDQFTLAFALFVAYKRKRVAKFLKSFSLSIAIKLLKTSWPLMLAGVILMVQARYDQLLIKQSLGSRELGYYSCALRIVEVFGVIPMVIGSSIFPALIAAKKHSEQMFLNKMQFLYRMMMVLFLLEVIPLYFWGQEIIMVLYRAEYGPAGALLSIMAFRLIFTNYGVLRSGYLVAENLNKYAMVSTVAGAISSVVLNNFLIPTYQASGAVWASMGSFLVSTFIMDFLYPKTKDNCIAMVKSIFFLK